MLTTEAPATVCPDCHGPKLKASKRCRRCAGRERKPDIVRYCEVCGTKIVRRKRPSGLEKYKQFVTRRTCSSPECRAALLRGPRTKAGFGASKSSLSRYAREHLKDACDICGTTEQLEAHHRDEDRTNNTADNIATLCKPCHLWLHWL